MEPREMVKYGTARAQSYDERYNTAYQTTYQCVVVRRIDYPGTEFRKMLQRLCAILYKEPRGKKTSQ